MSRLHLWFFDGRKSRHSKACPCKNHYFVFRYRSPSTRSAHAEGTRFWVDLVKSATRSKEATAILRQTIKDKRKELERRARRT